MTGTTTTAEDGNARADALGRIRIEDLVNPRLTGFQRSMMDAAAAAPVEFSVEAVLSAARHSTGLYDFGSLDFKPRLALWLQSFEEDTQLTALGRAGLFQDCVRHAANRLRIEDLVKRHPEILQIPIHRPIIVVGLPRSGTTHLLNLMGSDTRLRSLPYWESIAPVPGPEDGAGPGEPDPRQLRCQAGWEQFDPLLPLLKNMHEMSPLHVHEENELQGPDFSNYNVEWVSRSHRWRDHYLATDQTPHYGYMKKVLQALTWLRGPNRWVLKSPQHLENLVPLISTFPDATVVMTHRDPVAVIQSAITMIAYGDRVRREAIEPQKTAAYWIDRIEHLLRCCVRDHDKLPKAQILDVMFHEINADTQGVVKKIYDLAGLELTDTAQSRFDDYLRHNPRGKYGQILYDLKGDFGVDAGELRERFKFYFDRFPIRAED